MDAPCRIATIDGGRELSYDLLPGVPATRAPRMLDACGLTENGFVPVNPRTLETRIPDVYAVGDCAKQGTPKAEVFAEGAARAVAKALIARLNNQAAPVTHHGTGTCYIEYGGGRTGRVDIDFSDPAAPTGTFHEPSVAVRTEKDLFGSSRRARWFGM